MPQFAIIRVEKLKTSSAIVNAVKHNAREHSPANADTQQAHLNRHSGPTSDEVLAEIDRRIEAGRKPGQPAIRKDAVKAVEVLLATSPEFAQKMRQDERYLKAWVKLSMEFARERYGAGNVLRADLHLDEVSPHLQLIVVPLTKDGRLSAKDVVGDRKALKALQDDYATAMRPLGLERGLEGSRAQHQSIRKFYGRISEELRQEQARLVEERRRLAEQKGRKMGL
jgi:hypothetical protein